MPGQSHGQPRESKLGVIDGVTVYARRDDEGRAAFVDAIEEDESAIRDIADRLQRRGYGVMRKRDPRAGKVYHLFKARWAGDGPPPEDPFG